MTAHLKEHALDRAHDVIPVYAGLFEKCEQVLGGDLCAASSGEAELLQVHARVSMCCTQRLESGCIKHAYICACAPNGAGIQVLVFLIHR